MQKEFNLANIDETTLQIQNYEQLKADLEAFKEDLQKTTLTKELVPKARETRASINKLSKSISDTRKAVEKAHNEPLALGKEQAMTIEKLTGEIGKLFSEKIDVALGIVREKRLTITIKTTEKEAPQIERTLKAFDIEYEIK